MVDESMLRAVVFFQWQVFSMVFQLQVLQGLTRVAILGDFTRAGEGVAVDDISATRMKG